jgi:predicted DCC family thiol-disulfide oxidoreductase YuxK
VAPEAQRTGPSSEPVGAEPVVFFDGACGFCHRSVAFLLARDRAGRLRFAHLQGGFAARVLPPDFRDVGPDGFVVLLEPAAGNRISRRSEAVFRALGYLPAPWRWVGALATLRPLLPLADVAYRFVVHRRTSWFGRTDQCAVPDARLRARFLEAAFPDDQPA